MIIQRESAIKRRIMRENEILTRIQDSNIDSMEKQRIKESEYTGGKKDPELRNVNQWRIQSTSTLSNCYALKMVTELGDK